MAQYKVNVSDRVVTRSPYGINQAHLIRVNAAIRVVGVEVFRYIARVSPRASIRLAPAIAVNGLYHLVAATPVKVYVRQAVFVRIVVRSAVRFGAAVRSSLAFRIVDRVRTKGAVIVRASLGSRAVEKLHLVPSARVGWAKAVRDSLRLAARMSPRYKARLRAAEAVHFDTAVDVHAILRFAVDEHVTAVERMSVKAALHYAIRETIAVDIRTTQPDGTVTTWAINTRTGAVTEYTGYAFESFVELPDGTYLGAGRDGKLYAMYGNTDDGKAIMADIIGGMLDMGGSRFTGLKAVYLGARAGGRFYLRLTTHNDVVRTYEVTAKPMQTARIDIGKGLRSRYVQWELISTGQDFDLASIEFVPLVMTRRV